LITIVPEASVHDPALALMQSVSVKHATVLSPEHLPRAAMTA
jgi:hypothetical protein